MRALLVAAIVSPLMLGASMGAGIRPSSLPSGRPGSQGAAAQSQAAAVEAECRGLAADLQQLVAQLRAAIASLKDLSNSKPTPPAATDAASQRAYEAAMLSWSARVTAQQEQVATLQSRVNDKRLELQKHGCPAGRLR